MKNAHIEGWVGTTRCSMRTSCRGAKAVFDARSSLVAILVLGYVIQHRFHCRVKENLLNFTLHFALIDFLSFKIIIDHLRLYFCTPQPQPLHVLQPGATGLHCSDVGPALQHRTAASGYGMDKEVLDKSFRPQFSGSLRCKPQLGGIINSYYRDAAYFIPTKFVSTTVLITNRTNVLRPSNKMTHSTLVEPTSISIFPLNIRRPSV